MIEFVNWLAHKNELLRAVCFASSIYFLRLAVKDLVFLDSDGARLYNSFKNMMNPFKRILYVAKVLYSTHFKGKKTEVKGNPASFEREKKLDLEMRFLEHGPSPSHYNKMLSAKKVIAWVTLCFEFATLTLLFTIGGLTEIFGPLTPWINFFASIYLLFFILIIVVGILAGIYTYDFVMKDME